jgi:hypothetical protein
MVSLVGINQQIKGHRHNVAKETACILAAPGLRSLKKRRVQLEDLDNGQAVLVNYNFEEASERGFWYDAVVSGIKITSSVKSLACTISVGE